MKVLNLLAIFLASLLVRPECEFSRADLIEPTGEEIFKSTNWHQLVDCYNAALKIAGEDARRQEMDRMEKILKLGSEYRYTIIGKVLSIIFCNDENRFVQGQEKQPSKVTCDATDSHNPGKTLLVRSFGSVTPTSDYDFSIDFESKLGNYADDLAIINQLMNIIKETEGVLDHMFNGKKMNEILDSNAYPEIMEFAQKYLADDTPENIIASTPLENYNLYKTAVTFTVCEVANAILINKLPKLDLKLSSELKESIEKCNIFNLTHKDHEEISKTLRKDTLFPLDKGENLTRQDLLRFSVPKTFCEKNQSFIKCMEKATDSNNNKWKTYAMLGGCHHFAEEAYGTIGALAMVKGYSKDFVYNCRDFAEAFFENFSMLIAHWHDIYPQNDQKEKNSQLESIINYSFSSKLKYFKRMMQALEEETCYFLGNPKQDKSNNLEWNILKTEYQKLANRKTENSISSEDTIVLEVIEFYQELSIIKPSDVNKNPSDNTGSAADLENAKKEDDLRVKKKTFEAFEKFVNARFSAATSDKKDMFNVLIGPFVKTRSYFEKITLSKLGERAESFEKNQKKRALI